MNDILLDHGIPIFIAVMGVNKVGTEMKTIGGIFNNFLLLMDQNSMKAYYHLHDIHPSFKFGE